MTLNDTHMDYVVFGSGRKPLIIIPGLSLRTIKGTAIPLAHTYRIFSKEYRVFVFDRKADIPENVTVKELADDVYKAAAKLNIKRADVIGISQGGMIAQMLTLEHPELVHRLVLGVTLSRPNDTARAAVDEWVRLSENNDLTGLLNDMLERMYSENYVRKYGKFFPALAKTADLVPPERFVPLAKACLTCDVYERLNEIKCPVFVIGGKLDKIVTGEASYDIAEKLGCPVYMYDDLGHSAYEEGKDFNKKIYDFLTG